MGVGASDPTTTFAHDDAEPSASWLRRPRDILLSPINLVPLFVYPLYVIGREHGFVANAPLWALVGSILLAHVGSTGFAVAFPPGSPRALPRTHLALEMLLIGVVIYVSGWGAVLAVGFVFAAAGHVTHDGSRVVRHKLLLPSKNTLRILRLPIDRISGRRLLIHGRRVLMTPLRGMTGAGNTNTGLKQ